MFNTILGGGYFMYIGWGGVGWCKITLNFKIKGTNKWMEMDRNAKTLISEYRTKNNNKVVIATLNINSLRN